MDVIIRNANLVDGRQGFDIGIKQDKILSIQKHLPATANIELDATNCLVSPPFVDAHFHLDSTLSLSGNRYNESGTLLEGIRLWGKLKPSLTIDSIKQRAREYCQLAISQGLLAIRSHVDICDPQLKAVDALLDIQQEMAPYMDLQLVAFPQDGFLRDPKAKTQLNVALQKGITVVGGIPHFERTMEAGHESIRQLCKIAADRSLRVDMHCDETDDPMSRHVEVLAAETIRYGLHGRVTGSHLTSMHSMDNYYVSKLLPLMAEAKMHAIANPLINITLQGRQDTYPKRRGMTRVPELLKAGINVAFGHDCVMDPWYSLGAADMLEVANMGLHLAQLTSRKGMHACYQMITSRPAKILGLEEYGIAEGKPATLIILQAKDPIEAIRIKANRLTVMRHGKIIATTPAKQSSLFIRNKQRLVDPRR